MAGKKTRRPNQSQFGKRLKRYPSEAVSALLAIAGFILAFFFLRFGSMLIGLSVGICFFDEIRVFLREFGNYLQGSNLYRTIVWLVAALFLLLSLPIFIIFVALGCLIKFIYIKASS